MKQIKARNDFIILKEYKNEEAPKGLLIVPPQKDETKIYEVIDHNSMNFNISDKVIVRGYPEKIKIGNDVHFICREEEIMATVN